MKNKEEIKLELKEKIFQKIDQYVEQMDQGFKKDKFDISEIEELWGNAINECNIVLKDGTEQMIKNIVEKEIIDKKKQNFHHNLNLKTKEKES